MAQWIAAMALAAAVGASGEARAAATLTCEFQGKNVQVLVTNSKDGKRSCNAECVWRATNVPFRGIGGVQLDPGEAKAAFKGQAPAPVTSVYSKSLTCDRD